MNWKAVTNMSPLLTYLIYPLIGVAEWYLALRRTLACVRGERALLVLIVFIENLLGLLVLRNFVLNNDWIIAVAYSIGGSLGALLSITRMQKDRNEEKI